MMFGREISLKRKLPETLEEPDIPQRLRKLWQCENARMSGAMKTRRYTLQLSLK
jgi:hypothetical protein